MREIKFRGFEHNRMIYNPCLSDFENGSAIELNPAIRFYEGILMQFTGLKDKNGKEIYEGDIVKCIHHNPEIQEVKFIEGGFCTWHKDINYPTDINHYYDSTGCYLEVIGNIYENPELIKEVVK